MTAVKRLSDHIKLQLIYQDETPFGSLLSGRIDDFVRAACSEIAALRRERGLNHVVKHSCDLLARARRELGGLYESRERLREDCLYPPARSVRAMGLVVESAEGELATIELAPRLIANLASWLGEWQSGASRPSTGAARALWDALDSVGALTEAPALSRVPGDVLFGGHAMVRIGDAGEAALFDPFLLPWSRSYPAEYQPVAASELAPKLICVSHSHPDHFDLGSLLRFGADTPIYVPHVPRESILAVDMASRLREVGFTNVRALDWGESVAVEGLSVEALPFYGEQPTTSDVLHPDVRNFGNAYRVDGVVGRYALTVDCGADLSGTTLQLASRSKQDRGPIDALFAGYRAWALYPIRYLFSSVARYLLFVPEPLWAVRQKIMDDANDALDAAERWGARFLVPYADGGAPWYWQRGLGPRLDAPPAQRELHFDPPPEHVQEVARARSAGDESFVASPVHVEVARPGDALTLESDRLRRGRVDGHRWPYAEVC
ncbi:MAG TPA: MBL fold metallo-hydrolase [Polyangiaceae bacterium]|nr:MBL fold metallo-hydrolase [Polyangiaceae bacterium]